MGYSAHRLYSCGRDRILPEWSSICCSEDLCLLHSALRIICILIDYRRLNSVV